MEVSVEKLKSSHCVSEDENEAWLIIPAPLRPYHLMEYVRMLPAARETLKVHDRLHKKYDFSKTQEILGQDVSEGLRFLKEN